MVNTELELNNVILVSPVLGKAMSMERMSSSRPPRAKMVLEAYKEGRLCQPKRLTVVYGSEDEGYCPELTSCCLGAFGEAELILLEGEGHLIEPSILRGVLSVSLGTQCLKLI